MVKDFEKAEAPIRKKMDERKATLEQLDTKAKEAQKEVENAQKETEDALRAGNEQAYAAAAERLTRAQASLGYLTGRAKLLTAEPVLTAAELAAYETKVKEVLQMDEAAALAKLKGIVTQIREIQTSLTNSFDKATSSMAVGRSAASKEGPAFEILGDPKLRQYCHDASGEFHRMFKF